MPIISDDIFARIEQTLETKPLAPNVSSFKLTRNVRAIEEAPKWFRGTFVDRVTTGIAYDQALVDYLEGRSEYIDYEDDFILVPPTTLALAQRWGYVHAMDEDDHVNDVNRDPINAPEDWQLIKNDRSKHMLFDAEGEVLPIGLKFNYIDGMIRNGCYDIEQLVDYLKKHDQVHATEEGGEIELLHVPHYNVSTGCSTCCEFIFSPTQEQMRMIWEEAKKINAKYPSTAIREAVFNLDILGLRAAGICKVDNYWG